MITWGMLPILVRINLLLGLGCFVTILIPNWLKWPFVMLPALIFIESIAVLTIWGVAS
jgi:hypothetical protein